jgi:hypothetical protein
VCASDGNVLEIAQILAVLLHELEVRFGVFLLESDWDEVDVCRVLLIRWDEKEPSLETQPLAQSAQCHFVL